MSDSAARLLELLSLLQTPREWRGSELAGRLGVSGRTVRRDIERLRVLGYPVEATMGAVGGYRLGSGAVMPPLLLDDEEAVAIAVGLRTVVAHAVEGAEDASARALAKLGQVLPPRLRARVAAVSAATRTLAWDAPGIEAGRFATLTRTAANHERIRFEYEAGDGTTTRRLVEPHSLVAVGRRWYLVAWDADRDDWRTFRVDRIGEPWVLPGKVPARHLPGGDAAEWVRARVESQAPTYEAVATVDAPASEIRARLGDALAATDPLGDRVRIRLHGDTVPWLATRLMHLEAPFTVESPPELSAWIEQAAARLAAAGTGG